MTGTDLATQFLHPNLRAQRQIITPEGVPLTVELASRSERTVAFVIDLAIWLLASIAVVVLLVLTPLRGLSGVVLVALLLFSAFIVRNLYFIHFELAWHGATPGKRMVGIRVIDRRGGPLLPAAVIARNLTREIEIFIPLGVLISAAAASASGQWEYLFLAAWLACFVALVFFNRDRMRAGDLIAGTIVIGMPRQPLLGDLSESTLRYTFSEARLQAYGALELQVLEELLRRPDAASDPGLFRDVCDRICRKIGWKETIPEADIITFLRDFYTAQRAHLEREQLFGRPRADKHQVLRWRRKSGGT
ncbi:MAG: RDD family protein [Xanthobacteraceae bacterium]|nr:RDD family protein [Xanthobacteraceae bacterium]